MKTSTTMFCGSVLLLIAGSVVYVFAHQPFIAGVVQYFALVQASVAGQTKQLEKTHED